MINNNIITAIDIGSDKVCTIVAEQSENSFNILGYSSVPSLGMHKGLIKESDLVSSSVSQSISQIENQLGIKIESAYIGITGPDIKFKTKIDKMDSVAKTGVITSNDLKANTDNIIIDQKNDYLLHMITLSYIVDGIAGIKNPLGMHTEDLQVDNYVITADKEQAIKMHEIINKIGINIDKLIFTPLGNILSTLTDFEKDNGTILIDIGKGTTDIVVVKNNTIVCNDFIPVGGYQFTNDICVTYNTNYDVAEKIKLRCGNAELFGISHSEEIDLDTNDDSLLKISRREVCQLIRERSTELARLVKFKLTNHNIEDISEMSVVLTGGAAQLPGINSIFRQSLGSKTRLGFPKNRNDLKEGLNKPEFSASLGLLLWGLDNSEINSDNSDVMDSKDNYNTRNKTYQFINQIKTLLPMQPISSKLGRVLWK
ncbi:MAG: cell division protein FtsA [Chloroflexi bacterium]|nr:cell division protein FtsA [Chloroflexota bacterium]|tara:strand:- start:12520 stop:13800 length:1281 start_codon:yes stop_codon:yes gene_type:complete